MSLRRRILSGYLAGLTLLLLISGWALSRLNLLGSASEAILQDNYVSILAANRMIDSLERQDTATLLFLLGEKEKGLALFNRYQAEFEQWLEVATGNLTQPGEGELVTRIESGYRRYLTRFEGVKSGLAYSSIEPTFQEVRTDSGHLREVNQQAMEQASKRAQGVADSATRSVMGAGLLTCVVGLLSCLAFADHVTRPLLAMARATKEIAEGRFEVELPPSGSEEIADLEEQIRSMARHLKEFHALNVDRLIREKERTEAILDAIADGVLLVDEKMCVESINPAARRIFLSEHQTSISGSPMTKVCDHPDLLELLQKCFSGDALREPILVELSSRSYQAVASPVRSGAVLLLADVTHLRELDQLKTRFIMTASHELRTPITGLAMTVGLLSEQELSPQARTMVGLASEEVARLRRLVNELLDLSRLHSHNHGIELRKVKLEGVFIETLEEFRAEAKRRGVDLRLRIDASPPPVQACPEKLSLVLSNLVGNALRYTDKGGRVEVGALPTDGLVEVFVEDTGIGIEPEFLSRLFQPFIQGGPRDRAGGAGLGLSLCSEIVKAFGAELAVESQLGEGSRFSFALTPWKEEANEEIEE